MAFILFHFALNYEVFLRYTNAIARHKDIKSYQSGIEQILQSVLLNNADYASSVGFPIIILAIVHSIRTLIAFPTKCTNALDILTLAFVVTYTALLVAGQTRGEVGRLWIFMNPLIALFATKVILKFFKKPVYNIPFVVTLELITAFFIYKFQNFLS